MVKKPTSPETDEEGAEGGRWQPIKIRSDIYRILKTVASWKGQTIQGYLDELIKRELGPDLLRMSTELAELGRRKPT
jgi:hypothetical protein